MCIALRGLRAVRLGESMAAGKLRGLDELNEPDKLDEWVESHCYV